jgi:hypothetical protein
MRTALLAIRNCGKLALAVAGAASVLAAGVAVAATGTVSYDGHTSQGRACGSSGRATCSVQVTVDGQRRIGYTINYRERCYTPAGKLVGGSNGVFGFNPRADVTADTNGNFTDTAPFRHHRTQPAKGSKPQYFNSTDKVSGQVGSSTASGTFSFSGKFYTEPVHGVFVGTCKTGTVHWSAKKQ